MKDMHKWRFIENGTRNQLMRENTTQGASTHSHELKSLDIEQIEERIRYPYIDKFGKNHIANDQVMYIGPDIQEFTVNNKSDEAHGSYRQYLCRQLMGAWFYLHKSINISNGQLHGLQLATVENDKYGSGYSEKIYNQGCLKTETKYFKDPQYSNCDVTITKTYDEDKTVLEKKEKTIYEHRESYQYKNLDLLEKNKYRKDHYKICGLKINFMNGEGTAQFYSKENELNIKKTKKLNQELKLIKFKKNLRNFFNFNKTKNINLEEEFESNVFQAIQNMEYRRIKRKNCFMIKIKD